MTDRQAPSHAPADARSALARLTKLWIFAVLALATLCLPWELTHPIPGPEKHFLFHQDLPVAVGVLIVLGIMAAAPAPPFRLHGRWGGLAAPVLALVAVVACRALQPVVLGPYIFSLDEYMATFDAEIFRHGTLMAPVPAEWRAWAGALQPMFMFITPGGGYWASDYLPMHAAMRAAAGVVGAANWLNPALAAVSILVLYAIARKLWPQDRGPALAAILLLGTSAQFIVMSMTAYAMPAHLAVNLIWLWLFMKARPMSDAAAIGVGFVGAGLHQVIFHPIFVGPFILELLIARWWRRAGIFIVSYAAIGLFWMSYKQLAMHGLPIETVAAAPGAAGGAASVGAGYFVERALGLFATIKWTNISLMADCLIRFVTWQNAIAIPLAMVGIGAAFRAGGVMRPLALGIVVTIAMNALVMPTQTHGWGYRYLHGYLGSVSLLAVSGWFVVSQALESEQRARAKGALVLAGAAAAFVLLPLRGYHAWSFTAPMAAKVQEMAHAPQDVVLVDTGYGGLTIGNMVRNDPYLTNRPKFMLMYGLSQARLDALCRSHSVALWSGRAFVDSADEHDEWLREPDGRKLNVRTYLQSIGCIP